jgi:hypothetical protein
MTEEEWWLTVREPDVLLSKRAGITERQLILFGCACCRGGWDQLTEVSRNAVETAEQYADGLCGESSLRAARDLVEQTYPNHHWTYAYPELLPQRAAWFAAFDTIAAHEFAQLPLRDFDDVLAALKNEVSSCLASAAEQEQVALYDDECAIHADLLRDIVGNPFRPVAFAPTWRTSDAVALARQMYESRAFGAMPILADALQDAGCANADILDHCRDPNAMHVRGCWVVDLVLGKE